jgi:hypothetical protein
MLAKQIVIRHAGDVVAHDSVFGGALRKFGVGFGHRFGMLHVKIEKLCEGFYRALAIAHYCGIVIETREEEFF